MTVLGVDPGPTTSGFCVFDGAVVTAGEIHNEQLTVKIRVGDFTGAQIVIEKVRSYGRPVGASTFETVFWTGRMVEAARSFNNVNRIDFPDVKQHLCRGTDGKDADIRLALAKRFGCATVTAAKGTAHNPGPLRHVSGHAWNALAVAVVFWDRSSATRAALDQAALRMHEDVNPF